MGNGIFLLVHLFLYAQWQKVGVSAAEGIELVVAMGVESFFIIIQSCRNHGKIQVQDEIAVAFGGRIFSDIKFAEKAFEFILLVDVVIVFEHGEGKTLAESARADKEEILV